MRETKYHAYLDSEERTILLHSLVELKNQLIQQGRYTDCVDELIVKVINAPVKKLTPYVVNVYDLDIITKECDSYEEFIQYIEFRKQNHEVISTLDELDAFGFFKKNGNVKISIDADELMLTDFTADFDKKYKTEDKKVFQ